jgi:hypothetical protein
METNQSFETKIQLVLKHLQENKKITSWEAINLYRATRLSAIVFNLKERGHLISTEMVFENKSRYAIYHYGGVDVLDSGKVLGC